jgi:predicted cupin superfamily sugar epimerase
MWQIYRASGKSKPIPMTGTTGATESATIIAFLMSRKHPAKWWKSQKEYTCRRIK